MTYIKVQPQVYLSHSILGGLHRALKLSRPDSEVICAFDWDQNACRVYEENCGGGIAKKVRHLRR